MPALDLDALARAVAAVLERHGIPENNRRCEIDSACTTLVAIQSFRQTVYWTIIVTNPTPGGQPRVIVNGDVTPAAFDVLSTIWAHVHGQGEAEHDAALTELLDAVQSRNDLDWEDGFWGYAHYDAALRVEKALRHYRPDVAPHV